MMHVKSAMGIVLIVVALYFLNTVFPGLGSLAKPSLAFLGVMGAVVAVGLALGSIHKSFEGSTADRARKGAGVLMTSGGAFLFVVGATVPDKTLTWEHAPAQEAKARAVQERRPLIIDFTAAWCGACKELDKVTFSEETVQREAGRFLAIKVDATHDDDPAVESTLEEFGVVGLPTVVVFDSSGDEAVRFTDFVEAEKFASSLRKVN
jgi:thiol:disulfide interchange protein DsbD